MYFYRFGSSDEFSVFPSIRKSGGRSGTTRGGSAGGDLFFERTGNKGYFKRAGRMAAAHPDLPSFSGFPEGLQGGHCQDNERQRFAPTEVSVRSKRAVSPATLKEPAMIGAMAPGETGALTLVAGAPAWSFFGFFLSWIVHPSGRDGASGNFSRRGSAGIRCAWAGQ